jgi:predicted protein tyrosine phosphatase/rhodanese-related sulfurtransferase
MVVDEEPSIAASDDDEPPVASLISPADLKAYIDDWSGGLVVLDLRPAAHFYRGHVRGAVHVCVSNHAAPNAAAALAAIESQDGLDTGTRHALQQLPLAEMVVVYDSGAPDGSREGPAFCFADLLAADAGAPVAVLGGGYTAFARSHPLQCVVPPPSAGHSSSAGVVSLTPKGAASAAPATCCFEADEGRFQLWVGGARDAADRAFIDRHRITHIINATKELPCRYNGTNDHTGVQPLRYMKLGVLDECEVDLRSHLDGCVAFLEAARAAAVDRPAGNGALVHCYMGRSRSVTVAAAFIAAVRGGSAQEALEQIRERRPEAPPNDGFREQLEHWVAERSGDVPAPRVLT